MRNGDVGLLDVTEHFLVELFAQIGKWSHDCFCIGVFGFKVGRDFGILLSRSQA